MVSNEALPDPTIIPAFNVVSSKLEPDKRVSIFFRNDKCFDYSSTLLIPLKKITRLPFVGSKNISFQFYN
jgi:hypothetical protein